MNIKKLFKKCAIFISLAILSAPINTIAYIDYADADKTSSVKPHSAPYAQAKAHADPQTPQERSILERMYNLPGSNVPLPFEDFLTPLCMLYRSFNRDDTYGSPIVSRLSQLTARINLMPSTVTPKMDARTFQTRVENIVYAGDELRRGMRPVVKFAEDLLDKAFTIKDTEAPPPNLRRINFSEVRGKIASHTYTKDLTELYFRRVDRVGRPRILIIGSGRYVPKMTYIYSARCFPGNFLREFECYTPDKFGRGHANTSYDEFHYRDARWDYFLVDYDYSTRPDACLDITDSDTNSLLGEGQWDYIINEANGSPRFEQLLEERTRKLLKPGGKILYALDNNLCPENFDPTINLFNNVTVRYTKQIYGCVIN